MAQIISNIFDWNQSTQSHDTTTLTIPMCTKYEETSLKTLTKNLSQLTCKIGENSKERKKENNNKKKKKR